MIARAFAGTVLLLYALCAPTAVAVPAVCTPAPVVETCVPDTAPSATAVVPPTPSPPVPFDSGSGAASQQSSQASPDARATYVAKGAATFVDEVVVRLGDDAADFDSASLAGNYSVVAALGLFLLAPFLLVSAVQAVVSSDAGLLAKSLLLRVPMAVVVTVGALAMVQLGVTLASEMTGAWLAGPGAGVPDALGKLAAATRAVAAGTEPFAATVAASLVAVGAVLVWMEFALRDVALYACVLFLPLAVAGIVWPAAVIWARRLAAVMVAIIFAGFFVAVALTAGFAVAGTGGGPLDGLLLGAGVLLVAAAVPFAAARLLLGLDRSHSTRRSVDVRDRSADAASTAYLSVVESCRAPLATPTLAETPYSLPAVGPLALPQWADSASVASAADVGCPTPVDEREDP